MKISALLILFFTFFNLAVFKICKGQDPQFSQFYAAPVLLNPAFAGETTQGRASLINRYQWPGISDAFKTINFTYDHNLEYYNAAFGLLVTQDNSGVGGMRYTNYSAIYAHHINLNKFWTLKPAVQFGQSSKDIDLNRLTFGNQIYNGGGAPANLINQFQKVKYEDFASGILLYSRKTWTGFSVHHINRPNESLLGAKKGFLPAKFSLHGGMRYNLSSGTFNRDLVMAFNYKSQAKFDQLDLGFYYEQMPIAIGLWYRGLPIKQYKPGYGNREALIFMAGYTIKYLKVAYSYDYTISKLFASTFGSHELSLTYEFMDKRKRLGKGRKFVPCAKF